MDRSKPVLVTGATGSIGSILVRRLCASGRRLRLIVRNPAKAGALKSMENVEIIAGDLTRPESLRASAEGCSLVYHLAAEVLTNNWAQSAAANVAGTQAVLAVATRAGVERFVYASTIGVYGLCKQEIITEETPWAPFDLPYFKTKQAAERIVWAAAGRIPLTIARIGDVMGPEQDIWTFDLLVKCRQGLLAAPLDSQSGYLNPIYIDNVVDALIILGDHPTATGQIFNVVDGAPVRASDYFRRYAQMAGKKIPSLPAGIMKAASGVLMGVDILRRRETFSPPGSINYLLRQGKIYPQKIQSLLGWQPAVSQPEAFRRTELWLRQEGYLNPR